MKSIPITMRIKVKLDCSLLDVIKLLLLGVRRRGARKITMLELVERQRGVGE